jgi:hypothetical protein
VWSKHLEEALGCPPLVRLNGKDAFERNWQYEGFEKPDAWRARLQGWQGNVGMVMGRGRLCVDADTYKPGAEGSFTALVEEFGLSTNTVTQLSGRGGNHYVYACDPDLWVPSSDLAKKDPAFPHIEVKGDHGMIAVEPSVSQEEGGGPYLFEAGFGPGEVPLAIAPTEFLRFLGAVPRRIRGASGRWQPFDPSKVHPADAECVQILVEHFGGHHPAQLPDGTVGIYRPGKPAGGKFAMTFGYIGPGIGMCWTSNWPEFAQGTVYDLDQLRAMVASPTFPRGYRLWTPADVEPWPVLAPEAWQGPIGRFIELIGEQVEVSPEPIALATLTKWGTRIGRKATVRIGEFDHHANLFVLTVGESSTGAKGSADHASDRLIGAGDLTFYQRHVVAGFGSGEAVVRSVRDPTNDDDAEGHRIEKRRLVLEPEFARILHVAHREGSILSQIMRQGFDYGPLQHRTVSGGVIVATGHHLSILASVTPDELRDGTDTLEITNGWLNRFMAVRSHLVRHLPFGGTFPWDQLNKSVPQVEGRLKRVESRKSAQLFRIAKGTAAGERWAQWYPTVREGSGPLPSLTRRQHVQAARLALIYAVVEGSNELRLKHLDAAIAWVEYSAAVMTRIYSSGTTGVEATLLRGIRDAGEAGLSHGAQSELFHHNVRARELADARQRLLERHLIVEWTAPSTGGRRSTTNFAIAPEAGHAP